MAGTSQRPALPRPPRRRRWGRVLAILFALFVLAIPTSWMIWDHQNRRAFDRMVANYRARGEPILRDDLIATPIPDGRNAVPALRPAFDTVDDLERLENIDDALTLGLPFTPQERAAIDKWIDPYRPAFDSLALATTRPAVAWDVQFAPLMIDTLHPELNTSRSLANLLQADALRAHEQGNDALALQRIEQILFLANALQQYPTLIGNLVGVGIEAMAADTLIQITPALRADDPSIRQRVAALIAYLTAAERQRHLARQGLAAERVEIVDSLLWMPSQKFSMILLLPGFRQEAVAAATQIDRVAATLDQPDWPAARAAMPPGLGGGGFSPRYVPRMLVNMLMPSLERYVETTYRLRADTRAAATALAIRLYAIDHDGAIPESLDQLVPDYLPTLPLDPMAPAAQPLRYRPDPDRPVLYSVGPDGTDDGGEPPPLIIDRYAGTDRPLDNVYELRPSRKQFLPPQPGDPDWIEPYEPAAD